MAALVGVGPKAVAIALRGTDGLGHYEGEKAQLSVLHSEATLTL